jgi:hypothetical protein
MGVGWGRCPGIGKRISSLSCGAGCARKGEGEAGIESCLAARRTWVGISCVMTFF